MNQLSNIKYSLTDQLEDYKGNPIMIQQHMSTVFIFVSLYCSYCVEFLPEIATLTEKCPDVDVILFCNGTIEEHDEMINYFDWKFPIVYMEPTEAERRYDVGEYPFIMLIKDGTCVLKESVEEFDEIVDIMKGKGV
ncbi:TlpA family protein disulfide reductase [Paenibacillus arenosi]|uniref:Thioredoxin domain-containing protein n=1 Tax=Paenibacillus arenosi TaxID=2774142 RepID=A0ABR9B2A9_9BACL|nr:hypothetical protein [Paenibacillus arenosi]MBD8500059.1 hypothetical protein [Paenibacillus arenosi]